MSVGDIAGLIAAIAFVLLVGLLAIPLLKLGKVLDEARRLVRNVTDETVPLINGVTRRSASPTTSSSGSTRSPQMSSRSRRTCPR